MPIITRQENGAPLSWSQMDENLNHIKSQLNELNGSSASTETSLSQIFEALAELTFETRIVELDSNRIKSLGTPYELLSAPGLDSYYLIDKIIFEYLYRTAAYVFPTSPTFYLDGAFDSYIDRTLLTSAASSVCVISGNLRNTLTVGSGSGSVLVKTNRDVLNSNLVIGTPNGDNPTTGDGSLRIIIRYKTIRFGE